MSKIYRGLSSCPHCGGDLKGKDLSEHVDKVLQWTIEGKSHQWISYELRIPPTQVRKLFLQTIEERWPEDYEKALEANPWRKLSDNPSPDIATLRELVKGRLGK